MHVLERLTNATNSQQELKRNLEKRDEGRGRNRGGTPKDSFGNAI